MAILHSVVTHADKAAATPLVYNPTVTNIGVNQTGNSVQSTYNHYVTGLGFNQNSTPTSAISLGNNLLSMGFQRGAAVR
jgi:hypothetical protein